MHTMAVMDKVERKSKFNKDYLQNDALTNSNRINQVHYSQLRSEITMSMFNVMLQV